MHSLEQLRIDNRFARLGTDYFSRVDPAPLPAPRLLHFNAGAAALIDFDPAEAQRPEFVEIFSGNRPLPGGEPLAMLYAGHQFGQWVPQLGDGRAMLLGQVRNARGESWDLQLKGAGQTPYSRFADGRAVLRSSIREYLCGEAMHHLGIPSTRALCLIGSPLPVRRETVETAAIVCRMAPTHVRFGSFEVFYARGQHEKLKPLADHVIAEHFPECRGDYAAWLRAVVQRTAHLIAQWQTAGFCHGVMNTDNMSIAGLTLDYGPYGFLDAFDPHHICNHTDEGGRYAYDRQPQVAHWNLSRLIQACLPLLSDTPEQAAEIGQNILDAYPALFERAVTARWRAKLGLHDAHEGDEALINGFLQVLAQGRADFTRSFRALTEPARLRDEMVAQAAFDAWRVDYRARLDTETLDPAERAAQMHAVNPKYVLRNHLAQAAIVQAQAGSFDEIDRLMRLLRRPYDEQLPFERYASAPPVEAQQIEVSCSS